MKSQIQLLTVICLAWPQHPGTRRHLAKKMFDVQSHAWTLAFKSPVLREVTNSIALRNATK